MISGDGCFLCFWEWTKLWFIFVCVSFLSSSSLIPSLLYLYFCLLLLVFLLESICIILLL